MEVAGLAIGVAGLSGLFSACNECFELVQRGRYLGKDFLLLETKFANQKLRLRAWGNACGLANPDAYDSRLFEDEKIRSGIESTLLILQVLFEDGNTLRSRYGLSEADSANRNPLALSTSTLWQTPRQLSASLGQKVQGLADRVRATQKGNRPANKVRWAVGDRQKFQGLIHDLKELIDELEGFTRSCSVRERQREFIRREVESITDIPTLEAIEEAQLGQLDSIFDAASNRLCHMRGDSGQSEACVITEADRSDASPTSSQIVALDEEWDLLSSDSTSPARPLNRATHQYLYRVLCSSAPTAIFLDEPTYDPDKDNQWTVLDKTYPTHESRCLHLCGKRAVPDLEAYLLRCQAMEWIVIQDYCCQHDLKADGALQSPETSPEGQSIRLISHTLCSSLKDIAKRIDFEDEMPDFQPSSEFTSPYLWYYHNEDLLRELLDDEEREGESSVVRLFNFIDESMAEEYTIVEELVSRDVILWKYLPYLFVSLPTSADHRVHS